jgi:hypothetical protein
LLKILICFFMVFIFFFWFFVQAFRWWLLFHSSLTIQKKNSNGLLLNWFVLDGLLNIFVCAWFLFQVFSFDSKLIENRSKKWLVHIASTNTYKNVTIRDHFSCLVWTYRFLFIVVFLISTNCRPLSNSNSNFRLSLQWFKRWVINAQKRVKKWRYLTRLRVR